jgi:hypothetical protein
MTATFGTSWGHTAHTSFAACVIQISYVIIHSPPTTVGTTHYSTVGHSQSIRGRVFEIFEQDSIHAQKRSAIREHTRRCDTSCWRVPNFIPLSVVQMRSTVSALQHVSSLTTAKTCSTNHPPKSAPAQQSHTKSAQAQGSHTKDRPSHNNNNDDDERSLFSCAFPCARCLQRPCSS